MGRLLDGRYQLGLKLGEGGMGAVYRATHTLMGKPCAIKVLRGPAPVVRQAAKRFQREAQSASRLDHDHCIRVTDFGVTQDELMYLVMELLEGRSLAEELAVTGALPMDRLLHLAKQVAAALVHAHRLGIVHRDLKPDNIFLITRGGDPDFVKVLDFGLAKILDDRSDRKMSTLSEAGTVFGTPEYMAPEQAEGKPLDHRADLYSFGVVLYHMMTGQLPFQGATLVAIVTKHLHERPQSPAERRPDLDLPPALVDLCLRCLQKDPDARPQSAEGILADLEDLDHLDDLEPSPSAPPPRVPVEVASHPTVDIGQVQLDEVDAELPSPPTRRAWLYAVLAAPVVLALGIVAFVLVRPEAPPPTSLPATPSKKESAPVAVAPVPDAPGPAAAVLEKPVPAPASAEPEARPARPSVTVHLRAAEAYAAKGNRIKELFYLSEALRIDPQNAEALFRMGRTLLEDGQTERGCGKLRRARELGSRSAESLYQSVSCPDQSGH